MQYSPALGLFLARPRRGAALLRSAARLGARTAARAASLAREERERLVLFLPVAMGIGVATYDALRSEPPLRPTAAAVAVLAALCLALRRVAFARAACLALLAAASGMLSAELSTRRALPLEALPKSAAILDGTVRVVDRLPEGGERLTLERVVFADGAAIRRRVRIRLRDGDPVAASVAIGARVRLRALVRPPSPPAWPGAPDPRLDAFHAGLAGSGFALGAATELAPPGSAGAGGEGFAARLRGWREAIAGRIMAALPGERGAIASTLLVGISEAIPPEVRARFTAAGLAHLLAVAGLHIGIVMGLAMGATRFALAAWPRVALRWPTRQIASLAALAAGLAYLLGTGAHLPIVRSFSMAALATVAILIGRRAMSMRGLAFAAVVVLSISPEELHGVSFQMSFAAVAALIAGYEVARPVFARLATGTQGRRLALHVAALALTSALAGAASMPFAAARFGEIQPWFVLANLIAVPLTATLVLPAGLLALALMPFGLERLALAPMGLGIGAILQVARAIEFLPSATLRITPPPHAAIASFAAGLAVLCLLRTRLRLLGLLPIAAGLALGLLARPPDLVVSPDGRLVGFPDGRALMIERRGASRYEIEDLQRLWARGGDPVRLPHDGRAGAVACTPNACRIGLRGAVVLLDRNRDAPPDCRGAALVVAPFPLGDACAGTVRIDRFTVWREGAVAVRASADGRLGLDSDAAWTGVRPWTARPTPAARSALREAPSE